ncbi:MAG: 1,4-dihydroxy-2-naphthoate octaprenyltransferase [Candidatus Krumholzibacteriota bacterium]|nr:1,4-dihydroxy-2-naphthoate octaprenyltransferase [Candidatus Krumholzibacteriota bacterium]
MAAVSTILKELRAEFLTASVLPVTLAVAVSRYDTGSWDPGLYLLTLAGVIFLHLGTNTANDYYDHLSGADEANVEYARPFTGGSRLIQEEAISPRTVLTIAIIFFCAASVAGIFLFLRTGPAVIYLGITGTVLGFFYTAPPVRLASRGLGEAAVFAGYSLVGIGAYIVQTGELTFHSVIAALPLGLLTTAIIIINEFQDMNADRSAGKNTLVVKLGRKKAVWLFAAVILTGVAGPVIFGTAIGLTPTLTLISLLALPIAIRAVVTVAANYDSPKALTPANGSTIICHLATGILLIAAYIFAS